MNRMSLVKQRNYRVNTDSGKFIFRVTLTLNRNTEQPESFVINLGSREKYCVQIRVPSRESGLTDAYLMWVESSENCSLEKYVEAGLAKHMTLLGFTITRQLNPKIKTISFEDTSSFDCKLPNSTTTKVPMKAFYIVFYNSTWYEATFGAKLKRNYAEYCKLKENMFSKENKPQTFDFVNDKLQQELEPLYNSTTSWHEFFKAISTKYGKKKCGVIYPWLSNALYEVFKSNIFDDTKWYIDLTDAYEKIPQIQYTLVDIKEEQKGGKHKTMKKKKQRRFTNRSIYIFPNIREIKKWKYGEFIKRI